MLLRLFVTNFNIVENNCNHNNFIDKIIWIYSSSSPSRDGNRAGRVGLRLCWAGVLRLCAAVLSEFF